MLIVFCKECGKRINEAEVKSGKAKLVDENQYLCADCQFAAAPPPPSAPVPAVPASGTRPATSSSPTLARPQRITKQMPARKTSAGMEATMRADAREGRGDSRSKTSNMPMVMIGGSVVVTLIAIAILVFSGPSAKPPDAAKKTLPDTLEKPQDKLAMIPAPKPAPLPEEPPKPVAAVQIPNTRENSNEMEDIRNDLAAAKLRDAKQFANATPPDPWTYKEKLEAVASTFRSTPAGKEAQALLANLKVPDRPAPAPAAAPAAGPGGTPNTNVELAGGTGDWKTVIGPNHMDGVNAACREHWMVNEGGLELKPGVADAGQSAVDYGDGEFRIRFIPTKGASTFFFAPHQGGDGIVGVHLYRPRLDPLAGKEHEIVFVCSGDKYSAKLDGSALEIENSGSPRRGRIQFNYRDGVVRILSIDYRPLEKR